MVSCGSRCRNLAGGEAERFLCSREPFAGPQNENYFSPKTRKGPYNGSIQWATFGRISISLGMCSKT